MKKIYIIIISLSVCLTICGQTISQPNNRYRGSDVLEKKQVTVKGFCLSDTKGVWNLEEAELSEESYNTEYTTETDTLMAVERSNRTYYSQDRGAVSIIGSENFMGLMSYDMPETWLKFPMQVGDSVSGYFNATGQGRCLREVGAAPGRHAEERHPSAHGTLCGNDYRTHRHDAVQDTGLYR